MDEHAKKNFVLDTNVILHDSTCIYHFRQNDVVVPITVLEELDNFKKGHDTLNYHAREFVRALDAISGDKLFDGGVRIGPNLGRIRVVLDKQFHEDLKDSFSPAKADHHILNVAYCLSRELSESVILVSKDVNLRMKAKAIGLTSQDYTTDHVKDVSSLYTGNRTVEDVEPDLVAQMYKEPFEIDASQLQMEKPMLPHEFLILKSGRKSALATHNPSTLKIRHVDKVTVYGITPRNAEQTFALDALMDPDTQLVTLSGKAGTGKTLLALAAALEVQKSYRQIYLARPIVPLSNKDIGYLPGDVASKLDPYMQPLYDNLGVIQTRFAETDRKNKKIKNLLDDENLVISPLSYIRGRSLVNVFFIVDEAQNLTPHEVKTIITRAGEGTKIIFTGDIFQIDHPYLDTQSNGLSYLIEKMQGQNIYAHVTLKKGERSELAELASNLL